MTERFRKAKSKVVNRPLKRRNHHISEGWVSVILLYQILAMRKAINK